MNDVKEIRRQLWYSLDMMAVRKWFFGGVFLAVMVIWINLAAADSAKYPDRIGMMLIMLAISAGPFLGFSTWRTIQVFRHPESYHFCKTSLCNPKGGSFRDTIKFTVLIEDADGNKFAADTHSVFSVRGIGWPTHEDYVNRTVTVAYNEETGQVVVIG